MVWTICLVPRLSPLRSGNEPYVLMDQVCLLLFLFTGIFLTDRVYGADKIPGTFFKVTGNVTCGEKGKRQIQCFTSTACCKDKDGNAVGCMNGDQICCQGEYDTAKVCEFGSGCCRDNIGRVIGCASEHELCCGEQICTVGETCCFNEQGSPYICAAAGYTCCSTSTVSVCSPGQVCCINNISGMPFGCAEKSDQCCNNRVCGIGQTCCPIANICRTAGETCCDSTVCSQYQVCCGAFGKTCINTLEQECCNNQPCPKGKCCHDGTCAALSGELCCGLSKCVAGNTCCGEGSTARCCQNGQMCCGDAYSPVCCEIGEQCEDGQCTTSSVL